MKNKGFFISLEGGEGCGKSTQLGRIAEKLQTLYPGREIIITRSPGGTAVAERIRNILKEKEDGEEITPYETLDALLAFDLPAGEHTLTLRYRPREYNLALILSLSGGAALSLILFTDHLLKRKKQRAAKAAGKDPEVCTTTSEEI